MEMENIEQKQVIRLGKKEEYKIRPVLVKLKDEEAAKEVLVMAKGKKAPILRAIRWSIYIQIPKI